MNGHHNSKSIIRANSILPWLAATIAVIFSSASSAGATPITRDDFVCCDTSMDSLGAPVWPSVALDDSGRITLLNLRQQITEQAATLRLFLTRCDESGNLLERSLRVLPDTAAGDTIVWATGLTPLTANSSGRLFFPVHTTFTDLESHELARGITFFLSDVSGAGLESIPAVQIPGEGNNYRPYMAVGDINKRGICGAAWTGQQIEAPYGAKLFVRLYDPSRREFGKFIVPSSLPMPPDASGITYDRRLKGPPALVVAEDGGFVVAWIGVGKGAARLLYVVYDSSGRPNGPVRFADNPEGGVVRSINMAGTSDGRFYLVWSADRTGLAEHYCRTHLWMRGFDAEGAPLFDQVRVDDADSTNIIDEQIIYPSIDCDDSGNVLIAWADGRLHPESQRTKLRQDVFVQRFLPDGSNIGSNTRVNDASGEAGLKGTHSDCAVNNEGQAIVVWREFGEANTIKAQLQPLESVGRNLPGDLNCDLRVDANDIVTLRNYLLAQAPGFFWPRSQADLDGDSKVDISDLVFLSDLLTERN